MGDGTVIKSDVVYESKIPAIFLPKSKSTYRHYLFLHSINGFLNNGKISFYTWAFRLALCQNSKHFLFEIFLSETKLTITLKYPFRKGRDKNKLEEVRAL